jgi:phenylpropionate dioxygenase-like ring-hydroxylating dioxygenase large terminal subunit
MAYLRNTWYVAMWSADLKAGDVVGRTYLGDQIVLYRTTDGSVVALDDLCPHRFAPLHKGSLVDGCKIKCGYHGLQFDATGSCVNNPHGRGAIPSGLKVRTYPTHEKHSIVWIWMGDKPADPSLIPDFSIIDQSPPEIVSRRDWMKMSCNYELAVNNLMDLSHTTFLHDGLLGNEESLKAEVKIEQEGHAVTVDRFARAVPVPKFHDMMFLQNGEAVDLWTRITWYPPSCLINDNGATRPNQPRDKGTGVYGIHFLTPETDSTCYYHFVAIRQNPIHHGEPMDSQIREKIADMRRYAFEEQDHDMIKAQQLAISRANRPLKTISIECDVGIHRYKRVLDKLIEADSDQAE